MKNLSQKILGIIVIVAAIALSAANVIAQSGRGGGGGNAGGGGGSTGGCKASYDNYGGCYTSSSGVFWIRIPATSDDMPYESMHSYKASDQVGAGGWAYFIYLRKHIRGTSIQDCYTYGKAAYVLVVRMYFSDGNYHGLGAGMMLSEGWNYPTDGQGKNMGVGEGVAWETAHQAFIDGAKWDNDGNDSTINGYSWTSGSTLTWFCADYNLSSKKTTTTTTTSDTVWKPGCYGTRDRKWGETTSRIAVRNATLDKTTHFSDKGNWKAPSGIRTSIPNDSNWTEGSANVWTIAKPGDSIQFVHEYCVNARYARRPPTQDSWTGSENHTERYSIPTDSMTISATSPNSNFAFGDGISWMNSQTASVTNRGAPEADPFTSDSGINGAKRSADHFGIGTLSPTPSTNNRYKCSIEQYNSKDQYAKNGTFQIPGWIEGRSCSSATAVGKSDLVGEIITQKHVFRRVKAWEKYTHTKSGSCDCKNNSAGGLSNHTANDYRVSSEEIGHRHKWQCGTGYLGCDKTCDQYNEYNQCIKDSFKSITYPYISEDWEHKYKSTAKNYGNATKTASVYIPYNFLTEVKASLDATDAIFQGGPVESKFTWKIKERPNNYLTKSYVTPTLTSLTKYATYTPRDTKVQMIEFIMKPDEDPNANSKPDEGSKTSTMDPCAYFKSKGNVYNGQCQVLHEIDGPQNPTGDYKGSKASKSNLRTVPDSDEYVGYKYCVAVGIWPSDSHNYGENTLSAQTGIAMTGGTLWNVSHAACRTIAKKPSAQVWNGSIYTEGDIVTSVYKKVVNHGFFDKSRDDADGNNYKDEYTDVFGSWTDYAIISNGKVRGMSSGAVLGYKNSQYDLRGRAGQKTTSVNVNRLNALTIANTGSEKGKSGVNASSSIDINLQRLYSRYRDKAQTLATKEAPQSQLAIRTAETGMQYAYYNGSTKLSQLIIKSYGDSKHPNQTLVRSGNNVFKKLGNGKDDNTLVIYVTGDFTIDQNICLGDQCDGAGMKLSNYKSGTSTNAANELPQVLIFAKNISVDQSVTRVDAWLVTSDSGELNTCAGFKPGVNLQARDGKGGYTRYGNCYKTLIVNGPVYTKTLTLSRTAGAFHGEGQTGGIAYPNDVRDRQYGAVGDSNDGNLGSGIPAEIFNLRSDVYLWAYNQAQRYSEAVVTYMRELAPRY